MKNYSNLIEAINGLKKEGYTEDFNLRKNCIECRDGHYKIFHNEFVIDKYFRFEADTDPTEQSIIYAISSEKYNLKGILINGYGIYSDPITNEMLETLKIK
ncbi:MAG: phosphoribosylpyrophosphate synthetase [Bacteroidota bacterium]|nr:phosphoribosylpyrophosphate synthetase [Bacteroidota bacterium]